MSNRLVSAVAVATGAALTALALLLSAAPAVMADDDTTAGIGYVDQAALSSLPQFTAAKAQLDSEAKPANVKRKAKARKGGKAAKAAAKVTEAVTEAALAGGTTAEVIAAAEAAAAPQAE